MTTTTGHVLDVGNCDPDHAAISRMITDNFTAHVDRVMSVEDGLTAMRERTYDLVMFNRLIFEDGSPGLALLERAKADEALRRTPIMMISNFPESQSEAIAAGGVPGFGKRTVAAPETIDLLSAYLNRR